MPHLVNKIIYKLNLLFLVNKDSQKKMKIGKNPFCIFTKKQKMKYTVSKIWEI